MEVHPSHITAQDFHKIKIGSTYRNPKLGIAIKSSKMKSCFNVIPPIEYEKDDRKSDAYIFARGGLPSDHLFRQLRSNSLLSDVADFLESNDDFRKIEQLESVPVWITGFNYHNEFNKVTSILGIDFSDGKIKHRYAVSVSEMRNSDADWKKLLKQL